MLKKASLCAIALVLLSCASLYAQLWPLPSYTTPDSPQPCLECPSPNTGLLTPGWHDPVQKFVGRYVSSEYVTDWQPNYCGALRTIRAGGVHLTPDKSRIVVKLGNSIATYNTASFISRLDAHEPSVSSGTIPVSPSVTCRNGDPLEKFLQLEHFFNAEGIANSWTLPLADGQDRLIGFDVDDRNIVYMGYKLFGFGLAQDNGTGTVMASYQDRASLSWNPTRAFWVKDGTNYYAFAQRETQNVTHVYNVTNGITGVTEMAQFPKGIVQLVRGNGRVAFYDEAGTTLYIYDNHSLVTYGQPLASIPIGLGITGIQWDGTYWWVTWVSNTLAPYMSRFAADGSGRADFPLGQFTPMAFRMDGGYATLVTGESTGRSMRLYKTSSGTPVEIPVPSIGQYYAPNGTYAAKPAHMQLFIVDPLVLNGKLYLIVSADGMGDVWQIRTDDGVSIALNGTAGPANVNAPSRAAGDIFYGDTVNFSATLSSGAAGGAVSWNFGAPKDPGNVQSSTFGAITPHRYTGLTISDIASPLTVTATNPATSSAGTSAVTLKMPTARIAFGSTGGAKTIVTPGTSAPIVTDDFFYDASDGDSSGHYTDWRIGADAAAAANAGANYQASTAAVPVGGCGQHTLLMTAHYGYSSFAASNVDFPVAPAAFTYNVQPFAAAIDVHYNAATGKEDFVSAARAATTLSGRTYTYVWDVVDGTNQPVAAITPVRGTTTSISSIPTFSVDKSLFSGGTYSGRLTLSVDGADPCNVTSQAPMAAQVVKSSALVTPDATLTKSCVTGICTFTVTSPSNVLTSDAWTFSWNTTGGTPNNGTTATQIVTYTSIGTYNVSVVVTNKSGLSKTLTDTAVITTPASLCTAMHAEGTSGANVYTQFVGTTAGSQCREGFSCAPGEPINFSVYWGQYPDLNCESRAVVSWSFDGGAAQTAADPTDFVSASFSSAGAHTAVCTITIGQQTITISKTINVAQQTPAPPPPPPPQNCGTMSTSTVDMDWNGSISGCRATSGTCTTADTLLISTLFYSYNTTCATHSYRWSFDGGAAVTGAQTTQHAFTTPGPHTIACTINNGSQTYTVTKTVTIATSGPVNPCGTLTVGRNVFLDFSGSPADKCHFGGTCSSTDPITLTVSFFGYDPACSTHTYSWKVDGAPVGTGATATVTLPAGTHTLGCTLSNGFQSVDLSSSVTVADNIGTPATPAFTFDFTITELPSPAPPNSYVFTVTSVNPAAGVTSATQWKWDFGDGTTPIIVTGTAGMTRIYTFPDNKQYAITVQAIGNSSIVTHETPAPPARRRGAHH